jgi:signal recognition particle subunit SRP54
VAGCDHPTTTICEGNHVFATLSDRLSATFKSLRGKGRLSEADVDATIREIRRALLDADVALPVVRQFCATIRQRALSGEVSQALNPAQQVVQIVHEELVGVLGGQTRRLQLAKNPPSVILLAGLQGSGKTTLAGKLGHWLKQQGHTPLLVACDLQRPNAVDQLKVVGERAGVAVFAPHPGTSSAALLANPSAGVGDPVAVAGDGVRFARDKHHDVVIVDTAGRLGVDAEMMQQAADIRDAVAPDEILFVLDAMIGQDAVTTALAFQDGVGFSGVVLSKLDGDARGGAALSVVGVTGRPVMFASTGEKLDEFELFHPDRMASRILDMGDVLTLIEQAQKAFDNEQAEKMAAKFAADEDFTLDDFLQQMAALRNMGSIKKMLGLLPGMGELREQLDNFDEREMDRVEAIIRSMTPIERRQPRILNGSRRQRIARGSGVQVSDVNQLLERFTEAQKMMRQMRKGLGGMPGMPGMPALPGGGGKKSRGRTAPAARKGKAKSGNPAKRAQQERDEAQRAAAGPAQPSVPGGAFGLGPGNPAPGADPTSLELPPGFEKFLGR